MRYAITSDMHGNADGLEAVLKDCQDKNIDTYLFLGDYYNDFPRMNDCVNILRKIPNKFIVSGNKEDRLREYINNKDSFKERQFNALRWSYNNLSRENIDYIINLPETYEFTDGNYKVKMNHIFCKFYIKQMPISEMSASYFSKNYNENTLKNYDIDLKEAFLDDRTFTDLYMKEKNTIYVFGHNHIASAVEVEGNYFLNGGSSGTRLDYRGGAGYIILDINNNIVSVEKKTVYYNKDKVVENFYKSEMYKYAPIWSELIIKSFITSAESHRSFFNLSKKLKEKYNDNSENIPDYVWEKAYKTLKEEGYFDY